MQQVLDKKKALQNACEHCRKQRRKCNSLLGTNCVRCQRRGLVCFIKDTRSTRRRGTARNVLEYCQNENGLNKVDYSDHVRRLEQQVMAMEMELQMVWRQQKQQKTSSTTVMPTDLSFGQHINATVRSVSDMIQFLEKAQSWINNQQSPRLNLSNRWFHHTPSSSGWFPATFKCTPITQTIIDMLIVPALGTTNTKKNISPLLFSSSPPFDDLPEIELLKYDAIGCYFSCVSFLTPTLVPSYFLGALLSDTNSMLSNAVTACVVNGHCNHLKVEGLAYSRSELGGMFLERAHIQLQDALFENEPTLETAAALHLLSSSYMARFDLSNVKLMSNLAWRMINQVRKSCFDPYDKNKGDHTAMVRAEAWRRLFYAIRFSELDKCGLQIGTASLESIVRASQDVGCPELLPEEANDPDMRTNIETYQCFIALKSWTRISTITLEEQILRIQLCCSSVEKISVTELETIQRHIMEFWHNIPEKYRLSDAPIGEGLNMDRIRQCADPNILYLNLIYYRCWLYLEMRFMAPPETADMTSASLARSDRERGVLIASYTCDAVVTLTLALHRLNSCVTEIHYDAIVADVLLMLTRSTNKEIRERAQVGFQAIMFVLSDSIGILHSTPEHQQQHLAVWSHSPYVTNLKQIVETYFEDRVFNTQGILFPSLFSRYK